MIFPTLNYDARLYLADANGKPSSASFARATSAAYINPLGLLATASSGALRHDHAVDGTYLGWLIEEARTCYVIHNRDLTNAAWTKTDLTAAKDQIGIDGATNSASSITATSNAGTVLQAITDSSRARFQSAYVKRLTGAGTLEMTMDNGSTWTAVALTGGGPLGYSRVSIPSQTLANPTVGFRIGTSGDSFAIDCVQNENGISATSPIATTSMALTRAADVLSVAVSAFAFNAAEGTLYAECRPAAAAGTSRGIVALSDGTNSNAIALALNAGNGYAGSVNTGGVNQANLSNTAAVLGSTAKVALTYKTNDVTHRVNGGALASDVSATMPAGITTLEIGGQSGVTAALCGHIRHLVYFPRALSGSDLLDITRL